LKAWKGKAANVPAAQKAFFHRSRLNGAARHGKYSPDMEEAALVDGADRAQTLRHVVLPAVAPGAAAAALLAFLFSWNEFLFAYTFTATEASRTVPVALALFPGVFEVPWADIAAASLLASIPPILIVFALQRHLVRGLLAGALKE